MVGAGQLARMTHQAAVDLGIRLEVLAESSDAPAVRSGAAHRTGAPESMEALRALARRSDVVTFDHERVPADLAEALAAEGHQVRPGAAALRLAQDKLLARNVLGDAGFAVPAFRPLGDDPVGEVREFAAHRGWPVVVKARSGGYDGRGVIMVAPGAVAQALAGAGPGRWMVEARVDIATEVAVVGARTPSGRWVDYPVVETLQRDGICRELVMPARIPDEVADRARGLAKSLADGIDAVGIIAVELFVTPDGGLVVNELALRPHNSGHATIEGCVTSQFENHLRAVLDLPLGVTDLVGPAVATVNVLGPADGSEPQERLADALGVAGARIHLYEKDPVPGRKVGHVTALGADHAGALRVAREAASILGGAAEAAPTAARAS